MTPIAAAAAVLRPARRQRVTRTPSRWWLQVSSGVAWSVLLTWWAVDAMSGGVRRVGHDDSMAGMPAMTTMAHHHHDAATWGAMWLLMVIAMMWPLYVATAEALAQASFQRWRVMTVTFYVATITGLWIAAGYLAWGAYLFLESTIAAWMWSVTWLVVAIAATRSLWRARLLRTCERIGTLAPAGRRALTTATVTAARSWPRCAALCGPVMLTMVSGHQLLLMLGGTAAVWWEQRHPRSWRDPVPAAVLAATAVAVIATTLWKEAPLWLTLSPR